MVGVRYFAAAVVLATSLAVVPGAGAKKPSQPLTLEAEGQPLLPGAPLEATSSTFELENDVFDVHCTESSLVMTLKSNQRSNTIAATVHAATFRGGGTTDPEACEPAPEWVLTWEKKSATLDFFIRGEANLKGAKLKMIPRENVGTRHEPGCHLSSKNLKVRFDIAETPQPLVFEFASRFKMEFEQGPICRSENGGFENEPYMYGEFVFTSEGRPVEVVS